MNTRFEYNYIDVRDGSNSGGDGVILRTAHGEPNSWDNVPDIVFNRCYFKNNSLNDSQQYSGGLLLASASNMTVKNSVIVNNFSSSGKLFRTDPNQDNNGAGATFNFINNTIFENQTGNGNELMSFVGFKSQINMINNIIWSNNQSQGSSNSIHFDDFNGNTLLMENNILEFNIVDMLSSYNGFNASQNIYSDPNFRNPSNDDFRLKATAQA